MNGGHSHQTSMVGHGVALRRKGLLYDLYRYTLQTSTLRQFRVPSTAYSRGDCHQPDVR